MTRRSQSAALVAVTAAMLALAITVEIGRDRLYAQGAPADEELLYVQSPYLLRKAALSYDILLADVYWIRALQHYGYYRLHREAPQRYHLLYPLLDLTTSLDPNFAVAYRFGAIFLGEPYPDGPGRPDLAAALLRKGLAAQPGKWQYMQDLGFVYYWHVRDFKTAASCFQQASEMPGAPTWLRPLAAVTLAEGGHRGSARELFQQLAQSEEPWLRDSARLRLAQLDAMDTIDALRSRVQVFRQQHPGEPVTWDRVAAAGLLPGVPLDSSGTPFALDPASGGITVAPGSKLFPLPGQIQAPR